MWAGRMVSPPLTGNCVRTVPSPILCGPSTAPGGGMRITLFSERLVCPGFTPGTCHFSSSPGDHMGLGRITPFTGWGSQLVWGSGREPRRDHVPHLMLPQGGWCGSVVCLRGRHAMGSVEQEATSETPQGALQGLEGM